MSGQASRPLSRVAPVAPAQFYKTYQVSVPKATHTRPATCEEVGCEPFLNGWVVRLSLAGQPGLVHTVQTQGRPYRKVIDGDAVTFIFESGTPCFKAREHRIQSKPELYVVRGGDWRGNPRGTAPRIHQRPSDWVEDFALHQNKIADKLKEG